MCAGSEQYERVCKGEFASIHVKLDGLDEAIRGNGKAGIQVRLDRLEAAQASRSRLLWLVVGAAVTLSADSVTLEVAPSIPSTPNL